MRVHTGFAHVRRVNEGAPHCLVMEVVEVRIVDKLADQVDTDFGLIVCERTVLTVIAQTSS